MKLKLTFYLFADIIYSCLSFLFLLPACLTLSNVFSTVGQSENEWRPKNWGFCLSAACEHSSTETAITFKFGLIADILIIVPIIMKRLFLKKLIAVLYKEHGFISPVGLTSQL